MDIFLTISGILIWLFIGYKSFVYWWTMDHDYTIKMVPFALFVGIVGPFAYLIGMGIHGEDKILVKKKKTN